MNILVRNGVPYTFPQTAGTRWKLERRTRDDELDSNRLNFHLSAAADSE